MALNYQPTTACPHCNRENRPGELVCQHCMRPLSMGMEAHTRGLTVDAYADEMIAPSGTQYLQPDEPIVIEIEGAQEPVWVEPCRHIVLGRVHPQNDQRPDIDLNPYQGFEMGVSTRHIALIRQQNCELMIEDLASRNGTYLNGEKLRPHSRYLIHSGDHVRLGNLCVQINFGG